MRIFPLLKECLYSFIGLELGGGGGVGGETKGSLLCPLDPANEVKSEHNNYVADIKSFLGTAYNDQD